MPYVSLEMQLYDQFIPVLYSKYINKWSIYLHFQTQVLTKGTWEIKISSWIFQSSSFKKNIDSHKDANVDHTLMMHTLIFYGVYLRYYMPEQL